MHQGKARVESPVHHLLILPFIGVKPDERVEQALLRFAQTADRELAVEDGEGRLSNACFRAVAIFPERALQVPLGSCKEFPL